MRIESLQCPQCGMGLRRGTACSCGLDPAPLFSVVDAARSHAHRAAGLAAHGDWEGATRAASASLALQARENDLAVFVLLAARLAGATGGPSIVAAPRADRLPERLREFVPALIATLNQLHHLSTDVSLSLDQVQSQLSVIAGQSEEMSWLLGADKAPRTGLVPPSEMPSRKGVGIVAAAGLAVGVILGGAAVWVMHSPAPPVEAPSVLADPTAEGGIPREVQTQLDSATEELAAFRLQAFVFQAVSRQDWAALADSLGEMSAEEQVTVVGPTLSSEVTRNLYLAGLSASRAGRFERARVLLGLAAATGGPDVYFFDDAIYYQARALQRVGRASEATVAFARLIEEVPESPYRDDSERFLSTLRSVGH